MPVLETSTYEPPKFLAWSGHTLTIYPFVFRRIPHWPYERERVDTADGDFIDVDWMRRGHSRVAVICHGMEGCSRTKYVRGMVRALLDAGWDAAAMNFRGCSGEPNRTAHLYHSGATQDLDVVLRSVLRRSYEQVALVGFSVGGNLILKYLGERAVDSRIRAAVTFSVPCDMASTTARLDLLSNRLYRTDLTLTMKRKLRAKLDRYPDVLEAIRKLPGAIRFDQYYTAPYHGFASAEDYWNRSSSKAFLGGISVPTLIVNAQDDPILAPSSSPTEEARSHPHVHLERPAHGGHLGFLGRDGRYWSEKRAVEFVSAVSGCPT